MKLLFDEEGFFCEGVVPKKWQLFMEFGKIEPYPEFPI